MSRLGVNFPPSSEHNMNVVTNNLFVTRTKARGSQKCLTYLLIGVVSTSHQPDHPVLWQGRVGQVCDSQARARADVYTACMARGQGNTLENVEGMHSYTSNKIKYIKLTLIRHVFNLRNSFEVLTNELTKLQICWIWRRLHWQVVVNTSEVLPSNHFQGCPHRAIRSNIHTVYQTLSG